MSPHPQGRTSGAGQPVRVGRVGVRGWVPAQLAALHHEVGGQVSRAAAGRVDPGKFHEVFVVSVRSLESAQPPPLPRPTPTPQQTVSLQGEMEAKGSQGTLGSEPLSAAVVLLAEGELAEPRGNAGPLCVPPSP